MHRGFAFALELTLNYWGTCPEELVRRALRPNRIVERTESWRYTNHTRGLGNSMGDFMSKGEEANFCIVGCGLPGRGMGWYHGLQLVEGKIGACLL